MLDSIESLCKKKNTNLYEYTARSEGAEDIQNSLFPTVRGHNTSSALVGYRDDRRDGGACA